MLNVLGGLEKLVGSIAKPPVRDAAKTAPAQSVRRLAVDADATLRAGRPSSLGLEAGVTLEGIASTLNRIYAQAC